MGSEFQVLDSGFFFIGTWIPDFNRKRNPEPTEQNSLFRSPGFRNTFHGESLSLVECASRAALESETEAAVLCKINDNLLPFVNETRF